MHQDRPYAGILLMLGFCVLAPLGDGVAKILGGSVGLGVLMLTRFGVQAMVLVPLVLWRGGGLRLHDGTRWLVWLRSLLHLGGMGFMFTALRYLPLADALAITFVMPFIALLLGWFVLDEVVGPHRLIACAVGFVGTLLVIQPNFAAVGAPALLPLGVAVCFAGFMLVTRQVSRRMDAIQMQAVSGLQASGIILLALLLLPASSATAWPVADGPTLWLLAALGLMGTAAHLLMTASLRLAPAATLAPMQYLEIPIGTGVGWLLFRALPNGLAAVGIAVTVGAGLYIIMRERRLSRLPVPTSAV